ncbi:MAG: NAD(P)-dependent oxidoreductase [Sphingomonadaceae bacterium]|uniref:NAD(P)-dependent oxidoreductase n=1 Tax=Thermaurantiacus sp. TaxID=2820283 RepID=UPI00298EE36D|nr:NAD(P)-dependent oxidoreductase [Thermaurantiacus sp.]MCS6986225.1 NAD(P)-dependent oxidoreductase [Sphingomonadaceae bacterium]MDW8415882.1 NAD(P)-dependent oxidoreductase [Thermaurantiacus sp.]
MPSGRLLAFTRLEAAPPRKRAVAERLADFREIADRYARDAAEAQAGRCSQCGVPFCQVHCPLQNNIPDWLMLAAEGRLEEAYEVASATSTMPEVCGRICPQDRLCEGHCVIEQAGHGAVTIGAVERFIADTAWEEGWVEPLVPLGPPTGRSVGIVGSGPAGLAAAELLRRQGHEVHVYERQDRAGGLLTYGIPGFKLEKPVVMRRIDRLEKGGIRFHLNCEVGRDVAFAELRARHDALFLATGVYRARDVEVPGADRPGVVHALDYLVAANRVGFGDAVPAFADGTLDARGRHVVVVGGGDTAMDCVRTAVRQGAASVTCLYRRDRANMPGSAREVAHAEEEGVRFEWLAAPLAFEGAGPQGRVRAVRAQRMRLGAPDASGRRTPQAEPGAAFRLKADMVIKALGFDAEDLPALFGEPALRVTRWGTIRTEADYRTSLPGVFAGGDIVRGASLVVWALRDGRDAAAAIGQYLAEAASRGRKEAA